jgi:DNA primase
MAGIIPPDKLEQIRSANDIVDVIGAVLPLKRAGANFTALCPFHKEKSPSFNVNPHRQTFHCFGCHKGGDVFTFIQEYESLSFVEAVKRLAERASIPLEFENQPGQQQARHLKETLLQMHEQIAQRWQTALANDTGGQIARDYLSKRGVSEEAIKLFRLGYAPDAWDDTVNWAKSKGYDGAVVEQGGLIIRKEDSDRYYDRFRGRLMFPICDEQGRVIGFSGRVLSGDEKTAKYVNSPETPIFTKGKVFYGLDKSKRAILDEEEAILCEGQLDLIACFMAGVKNVLAPQGTALTADHARILKRYTNLVVVCFDADPAGWNAAIRSLDSFLASGLSVLIAVVPAPHDPDSFIKSNGPEAFRQLIKKADAFFDFYLSRLCAANDVASDRGRVSVVVSMREALQKTGNAVLLDSYAQKTALRLGVASEAVRSEFRKASRQRVSPESTTEENEPAEEPISPPSEREFWLLRFLLCSDDQIEWAAQHIDATWIEHLIVRRIIEARLSAHAGQSWRGVPGLIDDMQDSSAAALITEAVADVSQKGDAARNLVETVRLVRNDFIDRQVAALKVRLAQPSLLESEAVSILNQQGELRRLKQQPLAAAVQVGGAN